MGARMNYLVIFLVAGFACLRLANVAAETIDKTVTIPVWAVIEDVKTLNVADNNKAVLTLGMQFAFPERFGPSTVDKYGSNLAIRSIY
jgi:hypothetical protein